MAFVSETGIEAGNFVPGNEIWGQLGIELGSEKISWGWEMRFETQRNTITSERRHLCK